MDAHGRGADAVRLVDARGRTHLEQLYAHRQVPPPPPPWLAINMGVSPSLSSW